MRCFVCSMLLGTDTYLRLVNNATGALLGANDDACFPGSRINYQITSCGQYSVYEGCFSSASCSGTVAIISTTLAPTLTPSFGGSAPSRVPTIAPTSVAPSATPVPSAPPTVTGQVITYCPPYSTTNTNSAQQNYAVCTFSACAGNYVISTCGQYGGAFTGEWHSPSLACQLRVVLIDADNVRALNRRCIPALGEQCDGSAAGIE